MRLLNRAEALTAPGGEIAALVAQLAACVARLHAGVSGVPPRPAPSPAARPSNPNPNTGPNAAHTHRAQLHALHAHLLALVYRAQELRAAVALCAAYVG